MEGRNELLALWQQRLARADTGFADEVQKMDSRERLYRGEGKLTKMVKGDEAEQAAPHVRNIIFENIESQVSSSIPQPKVTACRPGDEGLAQIIENFLRNELDRLPFETMNDLAERTVPIQGGVLHLTQWDNTKRTHTTVGRLDQRVIHPKQLAPQPGIYSGLNDMDWFILKMPTTKEEIRRKYGINVRDEGESEPQIRGTGDEDTSEDALTQYIGYEKSESGGINRYSWVNDIELENLQDYQARRQPACKKCGRVRPLPGQVISHGMEQQPAPVLEANPVAGMAMAAQLAGLAMAPEEPDQFLEGVETGEPEQPQQRYDGGSCPWCGGEDWEDRVQEYEQVFIPVHTALGKEIPGEQIGLDELGQPVMMPTLIPFYKPDVYPLVLQKSVSVFGQLLGNSDVDAITDQQQTVNRIEKKIIDRLLKAGTRVTLPSDAGLRVDPEDGEIWYLDKHSDKNLIGVYQFSGDIQYELLYLSQVYEEGRQILGITDSFQGRQDPTATSGKAKEYAAAMAAGPLESKRVMKNAAYAAMFELMFKFQLAYADEPRMVPFRNHKGEREYQEFNRYDFLEQDADGQWYWNDQFLFSVDTAGPLASNREAMWQETRMNLQTGAFGDPAATETLVLFWTKMELLHYPGAGDTRKYLEEKLQREQQQAQQMHMMQMQMQAQQARAQAMQAGRPQAGQLAQPGENPLSAASGQPI